MPQWQLLVVAMCNHTHTNTHTNTHSWLENADIMYRVIRCMYPCRHACMYKMYPRMYRNQKAHALEKTNIPINHTETKPNQIKSSKVSAEMDR
mmetsp:Transcript_14730/g.41001  ORF Transcript_14730/g.41001 Transcript_14730/m.41001 type:complete len:93 (-) Transcript_14730:2027-2305(-)